MAYKVPKIFIDPKDPNESLVAMIPYLDSNHWENVLASDEVEDDTKQDVMTFLDTQAREIEEIYKKRREERELASLNEALAAELARLKLSNAERRAAGHARKMRVLEMQNEISITESNSYRLQCRTANLNAQADRLAATNERLDKQNVCEYLCFPNAERAAFMAESAAQLKASADEIEKLAASSRKMKRMKQERELIVGLKAELTQLKEKEAQLHQQNEELKHELKALEKLPIDVYAKTIAVMIIKLKAIRRKLADTKAEHAAMLEKHLLAKQGKATRAISGDVDMMDMTMNMDTTMDNMNEARTPSQPLVETAPTTISSNDPPLSSPADMVVAKQLVVNKYVNEQTAIVNNVDMEESRDETDRDSVLDNNESMQVYDNDIEVESSVDGNDDHGTMDDDLRDNDTTVLEEEEEDNRMNQDLDKSVINYDGDEEDDANESPLTTSDDTNVNSDNHAMDSAQAVMQNADIIDVDEVVTTAALPEVSMDFHTGLTQDSQTAPAFDSLKTDASHSVRAMQNLGFNKSPAVEQAAAEKDNFLSETNSIDQSLLNNHFGTNNAVEVNDVLNISVNSNNPGGDFLSLMQGGAGDSDERQKQPANIEAPSGTDFSFSLFGGGGEDAGGAVGGGDFGFNFDGSPVRGEASSFNFNFGGDSDAADKGDAPTGDGGFFFGF